MSAFARRKSAMCHCTQDRAHTLHGSDISLIRLHWSGLLQHCVSLRNLTLQRRGPLMPQQILADMTTYIHITTVHPHAYVIFMFDKIFYYCSHYLYVYTHIYLFSHTCSSYPTNHRRISSLPLSQLPYSQQF